MSGIRVKSIKSIIPHDFNEKEASRRFLEFKDRNWFSRTFKIHETSNVATGMLNKLVVAEKSPLEKVFLPAFNYSAVVEPIKYTAKYGVDYYETQVVDGKPSMVMKTKWYRISGTLSSTQHDDTNIESYVYGGFNHNSDHIEDVMLRTARTLSPLDARMLSYSENNIADDDSAVCDTFTMRGKMAERIAIDRIKERMFFLVEKDIERRVHCDSVSMLSMKNFKIRHWHMRTLLFPLYTLQYGICPPQILSGVGKKTIVTGNRRFSTPKIILASFITSFIMWGSLFSIYGPVGYTISVLKLSIFSSGWAAIAGAFNFLRPTAKTYSTWWANENKKVRNQKYRESIDDMNRKIETEGFSTVRNNTYGLKTHVRSNVEWYDVLELSPFDDIDEQTVKKAFRKQIKKYHPDTNGKNDMAVRIPIAKKNLLEWLKTKDI